MVTLRDVQSKNTATATATATTGTRPYVAVFTGGTAGIGMHGVLALARSHGRVGVAASRGLRVYIVGRRASDALLAECARLCPFGRFVFVPARDLSLLQDVDRVMADITAREQAAAAAEGHIAKIDLVVASQGVLMAGPRKDTPEGLELLAALVYYGRARVVDRLLPLLTATVRDGGDGDDDAPGRVAFVGNPNGEGRVVADDLTLRQPGHFTLGNRIGHMFAFTTWFAEALAARHPGRLALVHYYPGSVMTDLAKNSPLPRWARALAGLAKPVLWLLSVPPEECGQRVAFLGACDAYPARGTAHSSAGMAGPEGADGTPGSGAYRVSWDNDSIAHNRKLDADREAGMTDRVFVHTMAVFASIAATGKYTEAS